MKHTRKFRTPEEKQAIIQTVKDAIAGGQTIKAATKASGITDGLFRQWQANSAARRRAKPSLVQHIEMALPSVRHTVLVLYGNPSDIREALSAMEKLQ